jgi:tetratricopeptide (TPR) repeat protein
VIAVLLAAALAAALAAGAPGDAAVETPTRTLTPTSTSNPTSTATATFTTTEGPGDRSARLAAANQEYLGGDFAAAVRGYDALLAEGWESPTLHVNLGNARLRMGKRGLAAASYTRALRLDPGDADARANLALARAGNVDRVLGAETRPVLARLAERISDRAAAGLFAALWLALWAALTARRFTARGARALLAAAAVTSALGASAAGALLAAKAAARRTPAAVVVAPSTSVREAPEEALKPAFDLHEGTEVRVLDVRGAAVRIRLDNGLEGWVAARDLEPV